MNIIKNERNKIIAVIAFTICLITNSCTTTITKGDDSPLVIQKVFMNMNGLYNGRMDKTKLAYPYYLFFKCKIVNNTADTLLWRALKFSSDFEGSYEIDNESPLYAEVYCHLKNGDSIKLYSEYGYQICDSIQYIFPKDTFNTCFSFDGYVETGTVRSLDSIAELVNYITYNSPYDSIRYVFSKSKAFYIEHLYSDTIICGEEMKSCYEY